MALDQGTTSSRAILFDQAGAIVAIAQNPLPQVFPKSGWVEHDPNAIWQTQRDAANEVLGKANIKADGIAAIGLTNQRETTCLWDRKTGEPIHHAIVWQDRRTSDFCDELKSRGLESKVQTTTGLLIDPYFSASKLRWLLNNVPDARKRAQNGELAFGTVDSWLIWKLTDGKQHLTDVTNASRTMLYNLRTGEWDQAMLDLFDIPRELLPEVKPSSADFGESTPDCLGTPIKIAGVAGDQQAALFGQACFKPGLAKNTYGTGCFMLMNTGDSPSASRSRLLTTAACEINGKAQYALEGSVFIAGAAVQWLRDELGIIQSAEEVEALAASVPDTGGVHLVPAFTGLGAPYWDANARGTITGLSRGSNKAHIARAALEGIAHQVADVVQAMHDDSGEPIKELRVDGGASNNDLLMQFQADILGVPIVRPKVTETTALGAAYLAGLTAGFWNGLSEVRDQWQAGATFEPKMPKTKARELRSGWREALRRTRSTT